jgi:hypothetical protein
VNCEALVPIIDVARWNTSVEYTKVVPSLGEHLDVAELSGLTPRWPSGMSAVCRFGTAAVAPLVASMSHR